MALGALSLSTTQGVQGRAFGAAISGLTTGKVEVLGDGSPGFSVVNGRVSNSSLPYPVSTVVLREYEPGVGQGYRDTRIDITAATREQLLAQAVASLGAGRTLTSFRVAGERQADGTISYTVKAQDDLGATASLVVGSPSLPLPSFTTAPSISPASGSVGATFTANSGVIANGIFGSRRWLLSGTAIGTGITVVPGAAGSLVLEVTATRADGSGAVVASSGAVTVSAAAAAPTISGTSSSGQVGQAYSFTPTTTGGAAPLAYTFAGRLPPGTSFNTSTGAITGTAGQL